MAQGVAVGPGGVGVVVDRTGMGVAVGGAVVGVAVRGAGVSVGRDVLVAVDEARVVPVGLAVRVAVAVGSAAVGEGGRVADRAGLGVAVGGPSGNVPRRAQRSVP